MLSIANEVDPLIFPLHNMYFPSKHGDHNTNFFHGSATQRKRMNFIRRLWDENGVWQKDEKVVSALLNNFYTQLFSSSDP